MLFHCLATSLELTTKATREGRVKLIKSSLPGGVSCWLSSGQEGRILREGIVILSIMDLVTIGIEFRSLQVRQQNGWASHAALRP